MEQGLALKVPSLQFFGRLMCPGGGSWCQESLGWGTQGQCELLQEDVPGSCLVLCEGIEQKVLEKCRVVGVRGDRSPQCSPASEASLQGLQALEEQEQLP